jgi:hypothetical protein
MKERENSFKNMELTVNFKRGQSLANSFFEASLYTVFSTLPKVFRNLGRN